MAIINTNLVALTCHRIESGKLVNTTSVKAEVGVYSKAVYGLPDLLGKFKEDRTATSQGEFLGCDQFQRNIVLKTKNGILQISKDRLLEFKQDHSIHVANGGSPDTIPEAEVAEEDKVPVVADDEKTYTSVQDLINANPGTEDEPTVVHINRDITENIVIPSGSVVAIKLSDGATLRNDPKQKTDPTIKVMMEAIVVIMGTGTIDNVNHGATPILNNGTLTIGDRVVVTRSKEAGVSSKNNGGNSYYTIVNHGALTILDGTFLNNGKYSSLLENGYFDAKSGKEISGYVEGVNWKHPTAMIVSGIFSGGVNALKNDDYGIMTIKDGTFTGDRCGLLTWNKATIRGGTFVGHEEYGVSSCGAGDDVDAGELTITDGIFIGDKLGLAVATKNKPDITGGMFSDDVSGFLDRNKYKSTKHGNMWVVSKK